MIYHYTQCISQPSSEKLLLQKMVIIKIIKGLTIGQFAENKASQSSVLNGTSILRLFLPRLRCLCWRKGWKIVRTKGGGWWQGQLNTWTYSDWEYLYKICVSSRQTKIQWGGGEGHKVPPQAAELLALMIWERDSLFSLQVQPLGDSVENIWAAEMDFMGNKRRARSV